MLLARCESEVLRVRIEIASGGAASQLAGTALRGGERTQVAGCLAAKRAIEDDERIADGIGRAGLVL